MYYDKIVILAGHFCLSEELSELSNEGEAELQSFKQGLEAYKLYKDQGGDVRFYLWINDIGISKEERASIKSSGLKFLLPDNYLNLMDSMELGDLEIEIGLESSVRNKASKLLRQLYKVVNDKFYVKDSLDTSLRRCVDNEKCNLEQSAEKKAYVIKGPDHENLVVKEGSNPKCNLILATLFTNFEESNKSVLVESYFNELYENRVQLGIYVYETIFNDKRWLMNKGFTDGSIAFNDSYCSEGDCYKRAN